MNCCHSAAWPQKKHGDWGSVPEPLCGRMVWPHFHVACMMRTRKHIACDALAAGLNRGSTRAAKAHTHTGHMNAHMKNILYRSICTSLHIYIYIYIYTYTYIYIYIHIYTCINKNTGGAYSLEDGLAPCGGEGWAPPHARAQAGCVCLCVYVLAQE